jgi:hypothetical protein
LRSGISLSSLQKTPVLILCLGLAYGLLYVYLLPPWQHHDEPTHYEYARMIADTGTIPAHGSYNNALRLQLLDSMQRARFFADPSLQALGETAASMDPVWIGVTQVGDPPLYYSLVAVVLRWMNNQSIEAQMYAGRWVSLLIWLAVLGTAWLFALQVTPSNHPLRWIMPVSLALIPAFADKGTAFNNDIAAVLIYSLILLFGAWLLREGWQVSSVAALLALMVLSYFTKASIWLSFLVVPLVFLFTALRRLSPWLVLGALGLLALFSTRLLFDFDDAALWLRQTTQTTPTRVQTALGWTYQTVDDSTSQHAVLYQVIPNRTGLYGAEVTLGAWMWGQEGQRAYPPGLLLLDTNYQQIFLRPEPVVLQAEPTFYSASFELPERFLRAYMMLDPLPDRADTGVINTWRPVMTQGVYRAAEPLVLAEDGASGTWRGEPFNNLVRNSTLSAAWPRFKPRIVSLFSRVDPRISEAANWLIYSLDLQGTTWYRRGSSTVLFNSFWAVFGWGLTLDYPGGYRLAQIFSLVGIAAGLVVFARCYPRRHPHEPVYLLAWTAVSILAVLFFAWFTGISGQGYLLKPVLPNARYIFPVAIPLVMLLSAGWYALIQQLPNHARRYGLAAYFLFFIYLNLVSILTIYNHFYAGI